MIDASTLVRLALARSAIPAHLIKLIGELIAERLLLKRVRIRLCDGADDNGNAPIINSMELRKWQSGLMAGEAEKWGIWRTAWG